jgi:hypothetical protein
LGGFRIRHRATSRSAGCTKTLSDSGGQDGEGQDRDRDLRRAVDEILIEQGAGFDPSADQHAWH